MTRLDRRIMVATVLPLAAIPVLHLVTGLPPLLLGPLLLFGAPHVLATVGLYADRQLGAVAARRPGRFYVVPLLAVPLAVAAFWAIRGPWLLLLVAASFCWQIQHYTKQNVGMFSFWCHGRGLAPMTARERSIIMATTAAGVIGILRAVELVPAWSTALQVAGLAVVGGCLLAAAVERDGARTAALGVAAVFYAPLLLSAPGLLGLAFAYQASHGAQYYVMVGEVVRRDQRARWVAIVAVLAVGLAAVPLLTPALLVAAPAVYGLGKGLAFAHFIADARWWRLRDPEIGPILQDRFALASPPPTPDPGAAMRPAMLQTTPP